MISVIMSVYNEKLEWLEQAVNSILRQTYTNFEYIIICDNPYIENKTKEFLEKLDNDYSKIKILWNKKNIGLAQSLNRGIELAKGEFIARMDADDISSYDRLEQELLFLNKNKYDLVSSNKINIDEEGRILSIDHQITKDPNKMLMYGNIIIHSSVLVKKDVVDILGGYRELVNSEDWDLWLRMIGKGYTIGILDRPLIFYRIRSNSASIERQLEQFYISQYIVGLYKERIKCGMDSFSKKNMELFLKKKKITKRKQNRFSKSYRYIQVAIEEKNEKKWVNSIINISKALFVFPPLALRDVGNYFKSIIYLKSRKLNKKDRIIFL